MEKLEDNSSQNHAKELTVALERSGERAIWIWLGSSLVFYLINIFSSHQRNQQTTSVAWIIYSGILIVWILLPLRRLKVDVHKTFTKKECQQIYMQACGYKETFTTLIFFIALSALFICFVVKW